MAVLVREKVKGSGVFWVFINHNNKRRSKKVGSKKAANVVKREVEARLAKDDMGMLKEKTEIDSSTRKNLLKILKTMNKYRYITLSVLAFFLCSISVIMILIFGTAFGYIYLDFNIANVAGPACGIILFSVFIGVFVLMKSFQRTISRLLANIDTSKLALST